MSLLSFPWEAGNICYFPLASFSQWPFTQSIAIGTSSSQTVVLPDCKHQACLQAAKAPSNPRAALELVLTSLESTPSGLCTSGLVPFILSISWPCAPTAGGRIRWSGRRVLRSWQAGSLPGLGTSLKSAVTTIPKFFRKKRGAFSNRGLPFWIVSCLRGPNPWITV